MDRRRFLQVASGGALAVKLTAGAAVVQAAFIPGPGIGSAGFVNQSLALFAAMRVQPNPARKAAINTVFVQLLAAGIYSSLDWLSVTAANDIVSDWGLNWITPAGNALSATGSIQVSRDRGVCGTGASPGTVKTATKFHALTNFTQNSAFFGAWVESYKPQATGFTSDQGAWSAGDLGSFKTFIGPFNGNSIDMAITASSVSPVTFASGVSVSVLPHNGFMCVERVDASNITGYLNGVALGTSAQTSGTIPNNSNNVIEIAGGTWTRYSCVVVGGTLGATKQAQLYSILNTYMQTLGVVDTFVGPSWAMDPINNVSIASPEGWNPRNWYYDSCCSYDWEGVPFYTDYFEVPFEGFRRVKNLYPGTTSLPSNQTVTVISGHKYRLTCYGTGSVAYSGAASGTLSGSGANTRVDAGLLTAGTSSLVCALSGTVTNIQLEDVTYQSNQLPGEYVSGGELVYPMHGCGADSISYFTTQNGNTVSMGVVTPGTGAALNPTTVLKGCPNRTGSWNRCLQSENFGTTWTTTGTTSRSAAAKNAGPINLDLLGATSAANLGGYQQAFAANAIPSSQSTGANGVHAISAYVVQGSSTSSVLDLTDTTASATRLRAVVTWSAGAPVVTIVGSHGIYKGYEGPLMDNASGTQIVYRLLFSSDQLTESNAHQFSVYPATDSALSVGATGTIYVGGVQIEDYYIPTYYMPTTAAVAGRRPQGIGQQNPSNLLWYNSGTGGTFVFAGRIDLDKVTANPNLVENYYYELTDEKVTHTRDIIWRGGGAGGNQTTCQTDILGSGNISTATGFTGATGLVWSNGTIHKIAKALKTGTEKVCWDGGTVYTDDTSGFSPSVPTNQNAFFIGGDGPPLQNLCLDGYIRYMAWQPYPANDAALQALSS